MTALPREKGKKTRGIKEGPRKLGKGMGKAALH